MKTALIGKSKELEVASLLVEEGFYVFWPFVDEGYDLIVTNEAGITFIPIQVKYRATDPALELSMKDALKFDGKNVVLAYIIGKKPNFIFWLIPFSEWRKVAIDKNRKDGKLYITISKNQDFLSKFEGDNGLNALRNLF
jgi:hypothetical protein